MVLLTSSQVSIALSSAIVCFSALALFLAGYVLQQQTVRSLQDSIKPRLPSPHANTVHTTKQVLDPAIKSSRNVFDIRHGSENREVALKQDLVHVNWTRLAYLLIVKSHEELCGAVMLYADLARAKSPAQRVLLFPQHWALDSSGGTDDTADGDDPRLYTTKRLLRKAARRYRTVLVPMGTAQSSMDAQDAASYSIAPAFSLRDYDKLLLLPKSGVVLASMPMDSFLAFSQSDAAVSSVIESGDIMQGPLLLQPAKADYAAILTRVKSSPDPVSDTDLLRLSIPSTQALPTWDEASQLYVTTSSLCDQPANPAPSSEFNVTHFLQHTAFVKLDDEGLPGPEYDVPYALRAEARPRNDGARKAWERVYEKFRAGRQDVCGLELEPWDPQATPQNDRDDTLVELQQDISG